MSTYNPKYYDPVKAHEYYMRTRKLKGYENRYGGHRGDGTSNASKSYSSDAKSNNDFYRQSIKDTNQRNDNEIADLTSQRNYLQKEIKHKVQDLNSQIKSIRAEYSSLDKNSKKSRKQEFNNRIADVKAKIKAMKEDFNNKKAVLSSEIKRIKAQKKSQAADAKSRMMGGGTSMLSDEGLSKVEELKKTLDSEYKEHMKKANAEIDSKMLDDVKKMHEKIKRERENGMGVDRKKVLSKISKYRVKASNSRRKYISKSKAQKNVDYKVGVDNIRKKYYKR